MAENKGTENIDDQKDNLKKGFSFLLTDLWSFTKSILNLRNGLDKEHTVEGILHDVEFRGHNAWILVCSILIACIGLSDNNIPIIVGAMLISPLMGPILGIGLSAGTNDFSLLKKSLINYGIAFVISLIISTAYFWLVPVPEATFELIGRKQATVLAIAIAFLGGSAGIIAGSRGSKSNVVPGVAIATALMPPLCTVGYGLATMQWDFLFGALYLFFINSVFIAIPTYLYIKYMRFPVKEFLNPKKEKKIKRSIGVFLMIIVIPSGYFFYTVLTSSIYQSDVHHYIQYLDSELDDTDANLVSNKIIETDSINILKIGLMGKTIPQSQLDIWENKLADYDLQGTQLSFVQNEDITEMLHVFKEKSIDENQAYLQKIISANEEEINILKEWMENTTNNKQNWNETENEIRILFPGIESIGITDIINTNLNKNDTILTCFIHWNDSTPNDGQKNQEQLLQEWLQKKLNTQELALKSY